MKLWKKEFRTARDYHVTGQADEPSWPWRVVQLGPAAAPVFYIFDRDNAEVARFFGRRARANCELFMELRAQKQIHRAKNYAKPATFT